MYHLDGDKMKILLKDDEVRYILNFIVWTGILGLSLVGMSMLFAWLVIG